MMNVSSRQRTWFFVWTCFFLIPAMLKAQESFKQYETPNNVVNSGGYIEWLPPGYTTNTSQTYPLLVFLHGHDETGSGSNTDLAKLVNVYGSLPWRVHNGSLPTSFTVNSQTFSFIIISPQFQNAWPWYTDINSVMDYVLQHYRVDQNRIYVTGLSMGGGGTWDWSAAYPTKPAAIVPVCGASYSDATKSAAIANGNIAVWATHNTGDPTVPVSQTVNWVNDINSHNPAIAAKISLFNANVHDAWTTTYDPNFKEDNKNIYEWMLQYTKSNLPPTVNAGSDQTITLPTNSVTLTGTASDPDGSVAGYSWTKLSGGNASITSQNAASTTVTGLEQGTYVFRLQVTDNLGASATDDVTITVNAQGGVTTHIEAESYNNMSGVLTGSTNDNGPATFVGWIDNGDWMDYSYNAPSSGTYAINLRLSTPMSYAQLKIKDGAGTVLATVDVPTTGSFDTYQTVTTTVSLAAGQQTLRLESSAAANWNINWLEIQAPPPATTHIEAEDYNNMSGVLTGSTNDNGPATFVGWIDNGDWMQYGYNAPATGTYTVRLRLATPMSYAQLKIKKPDGTVLTTVDVPTTGSFDTYQTVTTTITLAAGQQDIRLESTAPANWNINWLEIDAPSGGSITRRASLEKPGFAVATASIVKLSPNPISDRFTLVVDNAYAGPMKVELIDMRGNSVQVFSIKKQKGAQTTLLPAGNLVKGQYLLRLSMNGWTETTKLIKL